jgi:cyclase
MKRIWNFVGRRRLLAISAAALSVASLGVFAYAQQQGGQANANANTEINAFHVQGKVWMLVGAGGNVAVHVGDQGVVVVDTGFAQNADKLVAAIRKLSNRPIQYIVNTHLHPDHTGGNDIVRRAGVTITGANVAGNLTDATAGAQIIAHENTLNRMSAPTGKQAAFPFGAWPTITYVSGQHEIYMNDEPIEIRYMKNAHTDGDSIVVFRRSDVVATGDIFQTVMYPVIDIPNGGSVQGTLDALNHMLDIAIPKHQEEGGTYLIPGHGRVCDEFDLLEFRDMLTIIRDRVQDAIKRNQTLDQIKKAGLTKDYDGRYGATSGFWTTDMFVEAVYKSLTAKK